MLRFILKYKILYGKKCYNGATKNYIILETPTERQMLVFLLFISYSFP